MSKNIETTDVETEAPATKGLDGLEVGTLSAADRKVLERLFGIEIPKAGTLRIHVKRPAIAPCACGTAGCDKTTASEFASGHDMRRKSMLRSLAAGETPNFGNVDGVTKAAAKAELARRGW